MYSAAGVRKGKYEFNTCAKHLYRSVSGSLNRLFGIRDYDAVIKALMVRIIRHEYLKSTKSHCVLRYPEATISNSPDDTILQWAKHVWH